MGAPSLPIPARWSSFAMTKQTPNDWACGIHYIAAAARHLGMVSEGGT